MTKAKTAGELRAQQMVADKNMAGRYQTETKGLGEFVDQYNTFNSAFESWKSGKGGATAETAMVRNLGMMFNKGAFGDQDAKAFAASDSTLQQLVSRVKSQYDETGMIVANPTEITRLQSLMQQMYKDKLPKLQETNLRYQKLQDQFHISDGAIPYYKVPEQKDDSAPMSALQITDAYNKALTDPKAQNPQIRKLLDARYQQQMEQFKGPAPGSQQFQPKQQAPQQPTGQ